MPQVEWLFLDMNAFFASCEQQLHPELRGRPVAVVPVVSDTTCCIAASYEARRYGVKTGTNVGQARRMCPGLKLVHGNHEDYIRIHHQILTAIETVLPIEKRCSIDEVACKLSPPDRQVMRAVEVAKAAKRAIHEQVGEHLHCSVGLAPNKMLAKLASDMKKPNGLTVITREELPRKLYPLELQAFAGIGRNMVRRLAERGVRTTRQLCSLSRDDMIEVWGSCVGAAWWHGLRGDDIVEQPTHRRTVSHSHVLPPALRNDEGARGVLVRLLHKAAARLRKEGYVARRLEFGVRYVGHGGERGGKWHARSTLAHCGDTPTMLKALDTAWRMRGPDDRAATPLKVSLVLWKLEPAATMTLPLFIEDRQASQAARTMDAVNAVFGAGSMYFASMHETRDAAPLRIAFTNIPEIENAREYT